MSQTRPQKTPEHTPKAVIDFDPAEARNPYVHADEPDAGAVRRAALLRQGIGLLMTRTPDNPDDPHSALEALPAEKMTELRKLTVELDELLGYGHMLLHGYTCDDCGFAPKCPWVFDLYNTGGDCIMEK